MVKKAKTLAKKASAKASIKTRKSANNQQKTEDKKEIQTQVIIPGSFKLFAMVFDIFKKHWKTLGGIFLVYLILNIVFASGLSNLSTPINNIRANINAGNKHFSDALSGFGSLLGSSAGGSSQTGSGLSSLMLVIESLVIIWSLRQLIGGKSISVKQAYYESMTPLIPFLLVVFVIIIQLLPLTLGALALSYVLSSLYVGGTAVAALFILAFILLAGWSFYMLTCSIVTLKNMQPRQALRSAKNLVRSRRMAVLRRLLVLPIFILLVMGAIIIPLILFAAWAVVPLFYALSMLAILFAHSYLYSLYRSLLG